MQLPLRTKLFCVLIAIFCTCLVIGDIIGGKLMTIYPFGYELNFSAGMIPFPITFLLTDTINEFYGKRAARFVTFIALGMVILTVTLLFITNLMPWWAPITKDPSWKGLNETVFNQVFNSSLRMLLASITAFVMSQLIDIATFNFLKRISQNRLIWLRATGSTIVSQLLDTFVVTLLSWAGNLPFPKILQMTLTWYMMKFLIAICLTPVIYAIHNLLEKKLGLSPIILDEHGEPANSTLS